MISILVMAVKGALVLFGSVYLFAALLRKEDAAWVKRAPLMMFTGLFVIGMLGHTVWVPYLALMFSIPLLSKTRPDAAALFAVAIACLPAMETTQHVGAVYLFSFTKWLFASLGLAIAFIIRPGTGPVLRRRFDLPFLIVLGLAIAYARDPKGTETLRQLIPVFLQTGLAYWLISRSLNTVEEMRRFVLAIALAGFVMAIVVIVEAKLHWMMYKSMEAALGVETQINQFEKMRGGIIRAPGAFAEATSLGLYLAVAGVATLSLRDTFASRHKFYFAVFMIVVGMFAPNSRGAFIGIGVGVLAYDLYKGRIGALVIKAAVGGLLYTILQTLAQFSTYFATLAGKGGVESSTDYRFLLLHRGLEEIRKHPVAGTNIKAALNHLEDIRQGEGIIDLVNGYITYGLVLGFPGIVGLVMVFLTMVGAMLAIRARIRVDPVLWQLGAFVFSVALFMSLASFYTGFGGQNSTPFYEVLALGSVIWAASRTALAPQNVAGEHSAPPAPSGIRAMIQADRLRAKALGSTAP